MGKRAVFVKAGATLLAICFAFPVAAQIQLPAPPVPGPYPLMPAPMAVPPGAAMGQPPGMAQRFGPPPGLQMPYWMQQPGADGAEVSMGDANEPAPPQFAPPAPGPGFGRSAAPGNFPGYAAPPMGGPGGFQTQPQLPGPGWGWGPPQGWGGGQ